MTKTSEQHPKRGPTREAGPGIRTVSAAPNAGLATRECPTWGVTRETLGVPIVLEPVVDSMGVLGE